MNPVSLFVPVLVLMLWTLLVLLRVAICRFRAAFAGRVRPRDFKVGESAGVPPDVAIPNRVFMNLLEVPVLFYVLAMIAFITGHVDTATWSLAWAFVVLRVVHSLIYLTYNHVMHRFAAFAASNVVVLVMILYLGLQLSSR